jgi:REP element-mobilizing transposase RayT
MEEPRGWYYRGYLPHFDPGVTTQFITWRTYDSLPAGLLEQWKEELSTLSESKAKIELGSKVNRHLDSGFGTCQLKLHAASKIVQDSLIFGHCSRYELHRWVLMPNHVHVLLSPKEGWPLERIVHGIKSFTAHEINKALGRSGSFWAPDYFDREMRNEGHRERTSLYIEWNPVKAKLCPNPEMWPYSSANRIAFERLEAKARGGRDARDP